MIWLSSLRTAETILPITEYTKGCFLFFDLNKPFLKGRLSCYINKNDDEKPKYKVSDKDIDGYEHLGRLVVTMRNYEV